MNKKLTILAIMALVAVLMTFGVLMAQAVTPSCGDNLTSSVHFDSDLACPGVIGSQAALTIGANNITVNLGGHTLSGPNLGTEDSSGNGGRGILVDGFNNVNILNGTIKWFTRGVRIIDATGIQVTNIEAFENDFSAVRVRENSEVVINRAYFHDQFDDHMGVSAGSHLTLMNSRIEDGDASGIFAFQATVHVLNNSFMDNARSAITFWQTGGPINNNYISGNNFSPSGGTDFGQISLVLPGFNGDITIRCNAIKDGVNNGIGFRRTSGTGADVEIHKNLIVNNDVGIFFSDSTKGGDPSPPAVSPEINKNTISGNVTSGLAFRLGVTSEWIVDATRNFWGAADGPSGDFGGSGDSIDNTAGNPAPGSLSVTPFLKRAQHCRNFVGVQY